MISRLNVGSLGQITGQILFKMALSQYVGVLILVFEDNTGFGRIELGHLLMS